MSLVFERTLDMVTSGSFMPFPNKPVSQRVSRVLRTDLIGLPLDTR
jgi:hypothetical protein